MKLNATDHSLKPVTLRCKMYKPIILTFLILETSCSNNTGFKGGAKSSNIAPATPDSDAVPEAPAPEVRKTDIAANFVSLDGARWELPCNPGDRCVNPFPTVNKMVKMGGDAATTYLVKLRIRGVVEPMMYTGGANIEGIDKNFYVGGGKNNPGFNIYELLIESPKVNYFLNRQDSVNPSDPYAIDYTVEIKINGQSNVTLFADNQNGDSIANRKGVTANGLTTPPALLTGQFIQMDVVSVRAAP